MQQFNSDNSNQLDEIESIREALNQTRTEMTRQRRRIEMRQLEVDAHIRRTNALWAVMILAIAGFGTAIFYGFHTGALAVRFPSAQTLSSHDQGRLSSPEVKLNSRNQSSQDQQNRISERAPSSESELATPVRNANEDIQNVQPQRESPGAVGAFSNPEPRLQNVSSNTRLLADAVDRNRIDFEVSRNKTQEVAPGIFLTVRDTNVERQQINGWLQISEDGRTVWLRDQSAQKVMIFTKTHDERGHELIFTRVGKQGVAGYLLIPVTAG
jgi:hypothetical protein